MFTMSRKKNMSNPNRLTPRAQEMFARVEKYLASGLSQKAFCAQEAIAFTTFQNWLKKYRARQRQVETLAAAPKGFIPLRVQEPRGLSSPSLQCVIAFPHGVIIRLSGPVDFAMLAQLIHATEV